MLNSDVTSDLDRAWCPPNLGAWYDGELGGEESARVATHVAACAACAREAASLRAVDAALGHLPTPSTASDLTFLVLAGVRHERRRGWVRPLAAAAAVILATGLGLLSGRVVAGPRPEAPTPVLTATLDSVSEAFAPGPGGGLGLLSRGLAAAAEQATP